MWDAVLNLKEWIILLGFCFVFVEKIIPLFSSLAICIWIGGSVLYITFESLHFPNSYHTTGLSRTGGKPKHFHLMQTWITGRMFSFFKNVLGIRARFASTFPASHRFLGLPLVEKENLTKRKGQKFLEHHSMQREMRKVQPGRQAHPRQLQGEWAHWWLQPFPINLHWVSIPFYLGKTTSKVKDSVQGEKTFTASHGGRVEISAATTTPRQIQVSKCPRCGSRRHLQFQEADLCVSKTSVQSTSCLESRWKLHVNLNRSCSQWIQQRPEKCWWAENCHSVCVYACIVLMCIYIYIYKGIASTWLFLCSKKFGVSGDLVKHKVRSLSVLLILHPCRTHYMPVALLRVDWEGDLLERKSTE